MAMRSQLFVAFCAFLLLGVDPVAAARVQKHESQDSESSADVALLDENWFSAEDRCARLKRNFNVAVSRVRNKAYRASRHPGVVSTASLVMTMRRLNRNFKLAAERECSWVSEQDADTDTMVSVAHENIAGHPCLPQVQQMMAGVNQSDADDMSTAAVQAVHMLLSGNCTAVEIPTEETDEQPTIQPATMEEISDEALDDVADVALQAEEQEEESVLLEQEVSLEQKPTGGVVYVPAQQAPVAQPAATQVDEREFWAVRAIVAIGLFILSIGLMCAAGPAVMAVISLVFLSVLVLFLAFFYTFIAVALHANPATGTQWLFSYLQSTWSWVSSAFGSQLANGAHWRQCFAFLR